MVYKMGKLDLLRSMDEAWAEAGEHSKHIEELLGLIKELGRPTPQLQARLIEETRLYDEAMHRYKDASRGYYDLTVGELA